MFNKLRLLTPGPTPLPEAVRLALGRDMIHHRKQEFKDLMFRVQQKLRQLFGTIQPVLPLACSGTGAMTAAVGNLFEPGQKVLVLEGGKFGQRWTEIALSADLRPVILPVEWGEAVKIDDLRALLDANPDVAGVLVQLCETSSGVLMPVREIAALAAAKNALSVVDGISGVGLSPCPMDEWGIDCLLTGSQKGLMLPPGLALLALSARAWDKARKTRPRCFYFNLEKERENLEKGQTHFTTPVNLVFALEASLDLLLKDGLESIYRHQWALTMLVRHGSAAMGLNLLAERNFAWGLTAICLPEGARGQDLLAWMQQHYGVCMAGGQDRLKNRIARLGHMGWVDWGDCMAGLLALASGLAELSAFQARQGWEEAAMRAYNAALAGEPGHMVDMG